VSFVTPLDLDALSLRRRACLGLEVLSTYMRVRWVMRDDDASRAVRHLRLTAGGHTMDLDDGVEQVAAWRLAHAMSRVLRLLPSDSRCLFRSLTLMCMLERRGIPQTLVIAARPSPFAAHAWIEVGGKALLPGADHGYERLVEL
jgi:hypothetical protein